MIFFLFKIIEYRVGTLVHLEVGTRIHFLKKCFFFSNVVILSFLLDMLIIYFKLYELSILPLVIITEISYIAHSRVGAGSDLVVEVQDIIKCHLIKLVA